MKEITIQINDRSVVIKKLTLGKYVEVLKSIKELPKHFDKVKTEKDLIANLPFLLAECAPDIYGIIHVATDLEVSYVENEIGMDDFVDIVTAILEVNNYSAIYEKIKKAMARPQSQLPTSMS